jgi:hypothetical protein
MAIAYGLLEIERVINIRRSLCLRCGFQHPAAPLNVR